MKSERRHELQQNDLAIYLDRINRGIEPYSRMIAVVVGAVVIGGIAIAFYSTQKREHRSDATLQLIQASASQDAEVLVMVSDQFPDTAAGAWAKLYQGKQYLSQGIQSLYSDRGNAEELLGDAQAAFNTAIAGSNDALLRSRANLGIALAAESLGNLDEAIQAYQEVVAVGESEAMIKKAEERIETLSNPKTQEFLAWFQDQDFSPADPSLPPSLPGGDTLPDLPDLDLPDLSLSSEEEMPARDLEGGIGLPDDDAQDKAGEDAKKKASEDEAAKPDVAPAEKETSPAENPETTEPTSEPADEKPADAEPASDGGSDP